MEPQGLMQMCFICKDKINLHVCVGLPSVFYIPGGIFNRRNILFLRFLYSFLLFVQRIRKVTQMAIYCVQNKSKAISRNFLKAHMGPM